MNSTLEIILTSLTISSIVIGALFMLLKKWFLDLDTYKADKEKDYELKQQDAQTLKEYTDSLKNEEDKLLERFDKMLQKLRDEKASAVDLAKSEARIEKLDDRISELTTTMEKQAYRLDILIENRNDLVQVFKELKLELNDYLKGVKDDIAEVKKTNTKMQLDLQAVKSRLE